MCHPITSFRARVGASPEYRQWRFYAILAINPEADLILFDCQFLDGTWSRNLAGSLGAFCDRTEMEVAVA